MHKLILFFFLQNVFTANVLKNGHIPQPTTSSVTIVNTPQPQSVTLNGQSVSFSWKDSQLVVTVNETLQTNFILQWQ